MSRARILVAGGGPAGCVTAIGLAKLGYPVTLVSAPAPRAYHEGFSDRVVDGLRFAGCHNALARIGPWVPRQAHWNGGVASANGEYLVERDPFDAALIDDALGAGVTVVEGRVASLTRAGDRWTIRTDDGTVRTGDFFIEARGRQASAGAAGRVHGPATTALGKRWRYSERAAAPRTSAASFSEGWVWFAAGSEGILSMMLMVAGSGLPPRPELEAFYHATLAEIPEGVSWLAGAHPSGPLIARNANAVVSNDVVGARHLRVGDAALAIDPLSGHGVFEAVSTALTAVPVVNTILRRPSDSEIAQRHYRGRVEHAFLRHARVGREFYAMETRWREAPFWKARSLWPDAAPAHEPPFSSAPRVASRPVVADGYVVEREVVITPDFPRGVWAIAGVEIVPLMHFLDRDWRRESALVEGAARFARRPVENVTTALGWLRHRGLLSDRAAKDAPIA